MNNQGGIQSLRQGLSLQPIRAKTSAGSRYQGFPPCIPGAQRHIYGADFILGLLSFAALLLTTYVAFDSNIDRVLLDIDIATTYVPLFLLPP